MSRGVAQASPFLTAKWRHLVMLNWPVPPELVRPYVPRGTELDTYDGVAYISVVGFLFADTRLLGVPIPWHRTFEEVNLRFYVRRVVGGEVRRGVTFLREFVPRYAVATLARWAYNEPYRCVPMSSRIDGGHDIDAVAKRAWYRAGGIELFVETTGLDEGLHPGSVEEFIAEHYWGYTAAHGGRTIEYRVAHQPWRIARARLASLSGDVLAAYGPAFAPILATPPASAWVANGSAIAVYRPTKLL